MPILWGNSAPVLVPDAGALFIGIFTYSLEMDSGSSKIAVSWFASPEVGGYPPSRATAVIAPVAIVETELCGGFNPKKAPAENMQRPSKWMVISEVRYERFDRPIAQTHQLIARNG